MALIALAVAWLGSIALVATWTAPWWLPAATLAALLPVAARGWLPIGVGLTVAMAATAAAGAARFADWDSRPAPALVAHAGQDLTLDGVIASLPDQGRTVRRYRFDVDAIQTANGKLSMNGAVLLTVSQYAEYPPGTRLRVAGRLDLPPTLAEFDYRAFLLRAGIAGTMFYPEIEIRGDRARSMRTAIEEGRLALQRALERALPAPEAALAAGISIGRDDSIHPEVYAAYRRSGLAHIIAVSGSNLALLTGIVFLSLVPLIGRNAAIVPAALAAGGYVLLAGADWPVVRAGIMAAIFLTGMALGRQEAGLAALGAAAIAMTAVAPGAARDIGFQLSVAATAGLIVFGPWIRFGIARALRICAVDGLVPSVVEQVGALSIAATAATLPIVWINFGQVSLVGPVANVLAEPLFVLAFGGSLATAFGGVVWEPLGWALGLVAYYPLAGCSWLARTLSAPGAAVIGLPPIHAGWAIVTYAGMMAVGWAAFRYPAPVVERRPVAGLRAVARRSGYVAMGGAVVAVVALESILPMRGPGALELAMLDVGQGDALLVTTPGGRRVLVDGGPGGLETVGEVGSQLPHWKRSIDAVILTHPQQDHVGGLPEVLRRYDVDAVYESGVAHTSEAFGLYRERAGASKTLSAGDAFSIDGVQFDILWPEAGYESSSLNNRSIVVRITYGSTRFLLSGDIEREPQGTLTARGLADVDVLKVPHHGSATNLPAFLRASRPAVALISVGADNNYGHPAASTLAELDGARVFRTDVNGRVIVRSDGKRLTVRSGR